MFSPPLQRRMWSAVPFRLSLGCRLCSVSSHYTLQCVFLPFRFSDYFNTDVSLKIRKEITQSCGGGAALTTDSSILANHYPSPSLPPILGNSSRSPAQSDKVTASDEGKARCPSLEVSVCNGLNRTWLLGSSPELLPLHLSGEQKTEVAFLLPTLSMLLATTG